MQPEIIYEIAQIGVEKINDIENVITEIRFFHIIKKEENIINRRLYVANINYINDKKFLIIDELEKTSNKKEILIKEIHKSFGEDQIKHMEKLLMDDYEDSGKKYIKLEL
jgi:hypothetical protein